jgi:hypothetical protein
VSAEGDHGVVVDWEWVHAYLEEHSASDLGSAYERLSREWLLGVAAAWGREHRLYESEQFLVVSARGPRLTENLVRLGKRTIDSWRAVPPEFVLEGAYGKFACLVADSRERFASYLESLGASEDSGASSGVFLGGGYSHFLINRGDPGEQEYVLVHELTHALLQGNGFPLWLEEGITQITESSILGSALLPELLDREEAERQRSHWRRRGLSSFWNGDEFVRVGRGQHHAYSLAQVLVRRMLERGRPQFTRFLGEARWQDHGEAACRGVYGESLARWAERLLGPGPWEVPAPVPDEGDSGAATSAGIPLPEHGPARAG